MTAVVIAVGALVAAGLFMAGEAVLSSYNERVLRARGAVEHHSGALAIMRWMYPASFAAMAIEGALFGPASPVGMAAGLALLGFSKALKMWVISTLGVRWTFRIFVLNGAPLIEHGPYAWLRHPNYIAIIGELLGVALIVWAPVTGLVAVVAYAALLRRKIADEDRALGRQ
jgi:methyltransferase